jgi:hypothetical protein
MYKKLILVMAMLFPTFAAAQTPKEKLIKELQDVSVTIKAEGSSGSGVLFARDGNTFAWTAGHVVAGLRHTRNVIDPATGTPRTLIEFDDAKVVKVFVENGRTVGEMSIDAEIIRYSDADNGEDLALMRLRQKGFQSPSVKFYLEDKVPDLDTQLYHVGSLLGINGSNSLTSGSISQVGRLLNKKIFDQTSCTAFPGSSGGGVFLKDDGRYCAMLVRGAGETYNLVVPIRRMREWAKSAKVEWALDNNVKMPTDEELKKLPIEDAGAAFAAFMQKSPQKSEFKYLIKVDKVED